jgi:hypothetical protein
VVKELIVGNVTPKRIVGTWRLAQLNQWRIFLELKLMDGLPKMKSIGLP